MAQWSPDDIPWDKFDASKAEAPLISLAKAASMVEHNGRDYARYLCEVFAGDEEFQAIAHDWAEEEVQHGEVLKRWAELADPSFNFNESFKAFTEGYKLPQNVDGSVRGSRVGELVARCVVETGTSSYYTAIKEYTQEPVLQAICAKIAADELRHYKLFYTHLQRYIEAEKISKLARLKIALARVAESEDDELAYAFFAAHHPGKEVPYQRGHFSKRYLACATLSYRRHHIERMASMILKACGLQPQGWLHNIFSHLAWNLLCLRTRSLRAYQTA